MSVDSINQRFERLEQELRDAKFQIAKLQIANKIASTGFNNRIALRHGLSTGMVIHISGKPNASFVITFMIGNDEMSKDNIPLRISVNFQSGVVLRNAKVNGDWTRPERYGGFPFEVNQFFDMKIRVDAERFSINVNGQDFATFDHIVRNLQDIQTIVVDGDVRELQLSTVIRHN